MDAYPGAADGATPAGTLTTGADPVTTQADVEWAARHVDVSTAGVKPVKDLVH